MPGIDLPSGIKTLNPVPVEFWSGPYTGADETAAKLAANTAIPSAVRFLTMEVSLIITGIGKKYWYRNGITDGDLVEFGSDTNSYVTLNTNQTITGEKTFNGGDLKLQGYDNVNAVSLTYDPGVGTGTVAFPDASGGTAKTIAYRDWVTSQGYITSNAVNSVNGQTGVVVLTTTNISEGSNLYYTSTRANNDFDTRLATKTTSDLTEGTNLYYTNTRFNTDFASKTTTDLGEGSNLYFTNARAIGATLTGYTSGAGTISSADSILQAIQKLNGNIAGLVTGVTSFNTRTGAITLTSTDVTDALTFTPYNASNPSNYIPLTALSSSATGLTYTNTTGIFSLTSGYVIPTTTQETDWNTAYGWGNHASAGYLASSTATSTYIPYSNANTNIDLNAKQLKNVSAFEATSIGIGRSPISKLTVYDGSNNSAVTAAQYTGGLDIQNGNGTTNSYALLRFGNYEALSGIGGIDGTYIQSITKGNNNTDLAFGNYQTGSGGLIKEIMRLTQAGNVGIGTTAPTGLLQVHGSANEVIVDSTGRLGIGFANASAMNASAAYKLQVNGAFTFGDGTNILGRSTYTAVGGNPALASESGKGFTFYVDNTNVRAIDISSAGNVGIGTTAPTSKLQIAAGTLADQTMGLKVVGTMPGGTVSSYNRLVDVQATSVNSTSNAYAFNMDFLAGATDANLYAAGRFANNVAGIGTNIFDVSAGLKANLGNLNIAYATTNGHNAGSLNVAWGGNLNVGSAALATTAKNSATNVGVVGLGLNTGTSPIQVGGYFGLQTGTPTFTSAALMADNGGTTSDIFVARDNGTAVFNIKDGGKVGIGTDTPSYKLDVVGTGNFSGALYGVNFAASNSFSLPTNKAIYFDNDADSFSGIFYSDASLGFPEGLIISSATDVHIVGIEDTTYHSIFAYSFVKNGGTSNQFLMADGTVRKTGYTGYTFATGATYTATLTDEIILANAGTTTNIYLPNVTTCAGKVYEFGYYNITGGIPANFSIVASSGQQFDIVSTPNSIVHVYNISSMNNVLSTKIVSNGTRWVVLQGFAGL